MELKGWNIFILLIIPVHLLTGSFAKHLTIEEIHFYRNKLKSMFNYAYENYATNAGNYDELKPITCQGVETWGNFSLTLIDSMDSLILFQNYSEFERVTRYIVDNVDFNQNINVSVFETNIRVVGGLLSAHLLSYKSGMELEPGWPCEGPLLRLAVKVGRKLLPAFQTKTGMPYGTVNLRYGVPLEETPVTCTAGVGTFIVEFATLSRLTGDPIFETTALNALRALHSYRSHLNLVGNHINTSDGKWTAIESSIGSGVDSYFEYLVKGALLLKMPELMDMFNVYHQAINKYMRREDWYFVVHMNNGLTTMPVFQSLESFFPGLLTLIGDIEQAQKTILNYRYVLKRYGFIPEFFDVANNNVKRNGNPLRPEFSESRISSLKILLSSSRR
ncbi:ER degradation-enhancing alpha-mannosidase-like protein 2 [Panonychus citri]|uniref:ER degradation-enhancing alpha-mannosidase-like protein 2 n=1 Tax=Panonychus citri TaxID=50023 RepID=UPI0023074A07|nr:ER degradation-enhancing alpha-mannosidase-like protein 2 [Panonychus citri]